VDKKGTRSGLAHARGSHDGEAAHIGTARNGTDDMLEGTTATSSRTDRDGMLLWDEGSA